MDCQSINMCTYAHGWFMGSSFMVGVQDNQLHCGALIAFYVWEIIRNVLSDVSYYLGFTALQFGCVKREL